MADSKSPKDRSQQADVELARKLALEKPLDAEMTTLINDIADDMRAVYSATGQIVDAGMYTDEITAALRRSYRITSAEFGAILERDLMRIKTEANNVLAEAIKLQAQRQGIDYDDVVDKYITTRNSAMVDFIGVSVTTGAKQITATNTKALKAAVDVALQEVIAPFSRNQVAEIAHKVFLESNEYRAKVVSATEIQNAAEGAKRISATALGETLKPITSSSAVNIVEMKEWRTRGDDKVRPAHRAADLQVVTAASPFEVGGERLMEPSDTSLGASAGNTINCRCSAVYYYEGERPRL